MDTYTNRTYATTASHITLTHEWSLWLTDFAIAWNLIFYLTLCDGPVPKHAGVVRESERRGIYVTSLDLCDITRLDLTQLIQMRFDWCAWTGTNGNQRSVSLCSLTISYWMVIPVHTHRKQWQFKWCLVVCIDHMYLGITFILYTYIATSKHSSGASKYTSTTYIWILVPVHIHIYMYKSQVKGRVVICMKQMYMDISSSPYTGVGTNDVETNNN